MLWLHFGKGLLPNTIIFMESVCKMFNIVKSEQGEEEEVIISQFNRDRWVYFQALKNCTPDRERARRITSSRPKFRARRRFSYTNEKKIFSSSYISIIVVHIFQTLFSSSYLLLLYISSKLCFPNFSLLFLFIFWYKNIIRKNNSGQTSTKPFESRWLIYQPQLFMSKCIDLFILVQINQ